MKHGIKNLQCREENVKLMLCPFIPRKLNVGKVEGQTK